jgi:superkiller protein 3
MHPSFPSAPLFALRTYLIQKPDNIYALHMMSLLLERDKQLDSALETLHHLSDILEQQYEASEEQDLLEKFCIVKSDIGRVSLGLGDYTSAVENCSTALDLSQELQGLEKCRLSSQITMGLGYYFLEEMESAIDVFQTVLTESNEDVDVMLMVARALWAVRGDQERTIAMQQIYDW